MIADIVALSVQVVTLAGIIVSGVISLAKVFDGQRCLLRSEMLRIYYHHQETKVIRQHEYENFFLLYTAYKKLKGNSFIDKVADEIKTWTVTT